MALPWLFHITDPEVAKILGPHLHELGGVVVADPTYLTNFQRSELLHTVGAPEGDDLPITIGAVDWTTTVSWEPTEPADVARDVYAMAASPGEFVIAWLGLDDEDQ